MLPLLPVYLNRLLYQMISQSFFTLSDCFIRYTLMSQIPTLSYIVYFLTNQHFCKLTEHTNFCLIFFWSWSDQNLLTFFINI